MILITAALLQAVFLMVPVCTMPVLAQSADTTSSTTTDTAAQVKAANEELLLNSDKFTYKTADIEVRKDAWNWYWNEKAHVNTDNSSNFWGDDIVSNLFKNVTNSFIIPFWNAAMEYDFIRAGLLLVIAGMLLGLGASLVMQPAKQEKQGK
ncbi:MAG TPA: hypothetical protein V6C97_26660 [Oculatellaceae cyanobacterium]